MENIKNNPEIITFLKSTSQVYQESGNEIIIHCPYCDDGLRANAKSHGHLYISTTNPVFHCFRCETSGHIVTLLRDLGFTNNEVLSSFGISKFLHFGEKSVIKKKEDKTIQTIISLKNINYNKGNPVDYLKFEKYIFNRLGNYCDINKYLITPEVFNKKLCAAFYNFEGNFVTARIIEAQGNYRYVRNKGISEFYFFQDLDFDQYNNIVITEGIFDAIKLYRFSDKFPKDETFFISVLGKNYGKAINWLASNHVPIGSYNFHLIFDNDNKFYKKACFVCSKIAKRINPDLNVYGYKPLLLNDAGDYPFIELI